MSGAMILLKDKTVIVYKVTNLVNGKIYIGQTKRPLTARWRDHCKKQNKSGFLKNAIAKYGSKNFTISVISRCSSLEEMNSRERAYINLFKSRYPSGYNLSSGGSDFFKHSDVTKHKLRQANLGKKVKKNTKEKISVSLKKHTKTLKHRLNISSALKNKKIDEKTRHRLKNLSLEYWNCPKNRLNMSAKKGAKKFRAYKVVDYVGTIGRPNFQPVLCKYVGDWLSQSDCAKELKLSSKCINSCLKGNGKYHKMYFFQYAD